MSKQITSWTLQCAACAVRYPGLDPRYRCDCGGTLDVVHDLSAVRVDAATFDARRASRNPLDRSGVWRFRELILPLGEDTLNECIVTRGEGNTQLYEASGIGRAIGVSRLQLKHEGENPTGSFKDRGMTAAISVAKHMGLKRVACASTGNTSASMASFAAIAGMQGVVFIPDGKIAYGKLCQALAYVTSTTRCDWCKRCAQPKGSTW
jgi:threonine synthase